MSSVPLCKHIKINGKPCGAPALKHRRFCYFHDESRKRRRASAKRAKAFVTRHNALNMPILEDANAVQVGLMETINALIDARITERQCGLILYALQTASANLKRTTLETDAPKPAEPWVDELLTALRAIPEEPQPERKPQFGMPPIPHARLKPQSSSRPEHAIGVPGSTIPRILGVAEEKDEPVILSGAATGLFRVVVDAVAAESRGPAFRHHATAHSAAVANEKPHALHVGHSLDRCGRSIANEKIVNRQSPSTHHSDIRHFVICSLSSDTPALSFGFPFSAAPPRTAASRLRSPERPAVHADAVHADPPPRTSDKRCSHGVSHP